MARAGIGLGSNLGDPAANVRAAIDALSEVGTITSRSQLYRTKPWGRTDQPDFCNAAAIVETRLGPRELLEQLKALEVRLGRTPSERWGPRAIDFDILFYDDVSLNEPGLQLPHPRLLERAFVLVPLAEIDERFAAAAEALPPAERASVEANP
ncbi:MAG TPA: 2-amino-4-hydroxy-6-hydroxymethyldihydropteridine diphosphokinase [Candidatus Rubrimentiphilum sp.]|nr:2-amino-4-hydroxy-6-hydroxymethyldihydropteridine diphosphokinase [Candidatus Rubrimentiphilum sp.]